MMASRVALVLTALLASAGQGLAAFYDAIAVDDIHAGGNGDYALGTGATEREAQRIAMSNCMLGGNVACMVVLTFQRCGAYALSGRSSGVALGDDWQQASSRALAACRDERCTVRVIDCVGQPVRFAP